MSIVPDSKPKLSPVEVVKKLDNFSLQSYPVKLLGIRGYYKQTMGNPAKNDRGIYDDAIFLVAPDAFAAFNANTDPSVVRKHVAVLKAGGPYLYKLGLHGVSGKNPYMALRQYSNVTVIRDQEGEFTDSANSRFWIDIHRGGYNTTSSLGCQTIYPGQWDSFFHLVQDQMKRNNQTIIPYCLIEEV